MKKTTLIMALLLSFQIHASETEMPSPFPSIEKQARIFQFEGKAKPNGRAPTGVLKFVEAKKSIQLQFEGQGLPRGQYEIVKLADCKKFKSNKEIFTFQTEYGDISTEENLTFRNLEEMQLGNNSMALLKVDNKKKTLFACAKSE